MTQLNSTSLREIFQEAVCVQYIYNEKTFIKDKIVTDINQVWCSDITYISILAGFIYMTAIIDIYS